MKRIIKKRKKMIAVFTVIIGLVSGGVLMADWVADDAAGIQGGIFINNTTKNVGIGTPTPGTKFVVSKSGDPGIIFENNADTSDYRWVSLSFKHSNSIGSTIAMLRNIDSNYGSDLIFRTESTDGSLFENMRLSDDGYLGIGTENPQAKLHLKGENWDSAIRINNINTSNRWNLVAGNEGQFEIRNDINSKAVVINANGKVGIGTGIPIEKLHIRSQENENVAARIESITDGYGASIALVNFKRKWHITNTGAEGKFAIYNENNNKVPFKILPTADSETLLLNSVGVEVKGTTASTNYTCSSDIRWKKNITPIESALNKVLGLKGVNYLWKVKEYKEKNFSKIKQLGFIAQEVEKVIPELVHTNSDGYKTMNYSKLTAVLVEAIKELKTEKDKELAVLKQENETLKKRLASLEKLESRMATLEQALNKKEVVIGMKKIKP